MGKLIEMLRRLIVTILWLTAGAIAFDNLSDAYTLYQRTDGISDWQAAAKREAIGSVIILLAALFLHKVLNWIMLKTEKPFED